MDLQFIISELRADGIAVTKANVKAKAQELIAGQALLDESLAELAPAPAPQDTTQHDAVETYLQNLKATDPDQCEQVRKKSFAELVILAGA